MSGAAPLVHADRCPEPPPIVRPYPTRHGDRVSWCPACCRCGIEPRPTTTTAPTHTPRRFRELPHPDHLDYLEDQ